MEELIEQALQALVSLAEFEEFALEDDHGLKVAGHLLLCREVLDGLVFLNSEFEEVEGLAIVGSPNDEVVGLLLHGVAEAEQSAIILRGHGLQRHHVFEGVHIVASAHVHTGRVLVSPEGDQVAHDRLDGVRGLLALHEDCSLLTLNNLCSLLFEDLPSLVGLCLLDELGLCCEGAQVEHLLLCILSAFACLLELLL